MHYLVISSLILCCRLCLAGDFPEDTKDIQFLNPKQASDLVAEYRGNKLNLNGITSIDEDVAKELANYKGETLYLRGLTSISKSVAHKLVNFKGLELLPSWTGFD